MYVTALAKKLRGDVGRKQSQNQSQLLENRVTRAWCLQGLYQERRGWWFQDRPLVQERRRSSADGQIFGRLETSPKIFRTQVSRGKDKEGDEKGKSG